MHINSWRVHLTNTPQMNENESTRGSRDQFPWIPAYLALLLFAFAVVIKPVDLRRRATTVLIDKKGTARLGGVVPLRNKKIRDMAIWAASQLDGGQLTVVADKSAKLTSVIEVLDSMGKAGATLDSRPQIGPSLRPRGTQ